MQSKKYYTFLLRYVERLEDKHLNGYNCIQCSHSGALCPAAANATRTHSGRIDVSVELSGVKK